MRIQKLIKPRLQLKLMAWATGLCAFGLLFQYLFMTSVLSELALDLDGESSKNFELVQEATARILLTSMLVILPLSAIVSTLTSFRVAGPIHRLEQYLRDFLRGGTISACRLRKGDEMQELCQLISEATAASTRRGQAADEESAKDRRVA